MRRSLIAAAAAVLLAAPFAPASSQTSADRARVIAPGQPVSGTITDQHPPDPEERRHEIWSFDGRRGERVSVLMWSDDLDPYLELAFRAGGSHLERLAADDDSGGSLDAAIDFILQEDGSYRIFAMALPGGTGDYGLIMRVEDPAAPLARPSSVVPVSVQTRSIRAGETVSGTLESGDPTAFDDSFFDRYSYEGTQGELVIVELRSSDFDAFLTIEADAPGEPTTLQSNDDGGDGTDSLLALRLPSTGTYFIRAGSLSAGEIGRYELIVRRPN